MASCTFSSQGTRWKVWSVDAATSANEGEPPTTAAGFTGLVFESADGEKRELRLTSADLRALGDVTAQGNDALGRLVARAAGGPPPAGFSSPAAR